MTRSIFVCWAAGALLAASAVAIPVAHAGPPPPCSFTLSPPQTADGTVTATVTPAQCGFPATPYMSVACLQALGADMQCAQGHGVEGARISAPLQPGTTYVSSGRGCGAWVGQSVAPDCQLLGPMQATL